MKKHAKNTNKRLVAIKGKQISNLHFIFGYELYMSFIT
jgi:hypothetical protein